MNPSNDTPGVFVSHASEDSDRFARRFAERLRAGGCRVWFDEWEILPGDSLVDKVFDEGLKNADTMVIVLSVNSVDKPWVREELNAGFLKRLEGRCRLIPVVLDDVDVPEAMRSTVWQKIRDLDSYDEELDRILRAIHDDRSQPTPGQRPRYTQTIAIPGFYSTDTLVLRKAGDATVESDGDFVHSRPLLDRLGNEGITEQAFLDSLVVLEEHGYIRVHRTHGSGLEAASSFSLTTLGLEEYATNFLDGYADMQTKVVAALVNTERRTDREISVEIGAPRVLVDHVFDLLEARGLLKLSKMTGPTSQVFHVSPQLGRMLAET